MAGLLRLLFFSSAVLLSVVLSDGEDDLVVDLPGLLFKPNFNVYSGYLNANSNGTWKMHYWLTESRNNPANDPLLVWFNGGPGCSSLAGMFEELGPFYVTEDGQYLFENIHSWNQRANVLALESPIGVGFSYDTTNAKFIDASDDLTVEQNFAALADFFARVQPKYKDRTFFLSGESYAGIYIPMLTDKLIQNINAKTFPNANFQGSAIGNGYMDTKTGTNSHVLWGYHHGQLSVQQWNYIKKNCSTGNETDVENYDFRQFLHYTEGGNPFTDFEADQSQCGQYIRAALNTPDGMDPYNYYQDCYQEGGYSPPGGRRGKKSMAGRGRVAGGRVRHANAQQAIAAARPDHNPADDMWQDSSDPKRGYPCWNDKALSIYANRDDVQKAAHINDDWRGRKAQWEECSDLNYDATYHTMRAQFDRILQNAKMPNFRVLIYNGDVDTVCNYLGDAWFMKDVADGNGLIDQGGRSEWYYRNQTAGFAQRYTNGSIILDVITVKGSGHMVPTDRPGQSAQMITNFVSSGASNGIDYSSSKLVNPTPKPLPMIENSVTTTTAIPTTSTASSTASLTTAALLSLLSLFL